jgi:rhamnose transport system ATP-binding protein
MELLRLSDIDKAFGGVSALRAAHLEVRAGEVHGLVGENGAGKSTLINIATGLLKPDGGVVALHGAPLVLANTGEARRHGIAVVHQESDLFAQMSIAENMLLSRGLVRNAAGFIRWPATYQAADAFVADMGEAFNVRQMAGGLPVARRMMAEIAAAISEEARVLFLDEPTASLTLKEIENLFAQIRRLRAEGVGIVYVSHRLEEILAICDRVTIMRDGATIETRAIGDVTMDRMVATMVGRQMEARGVKRAVPIGDVRLRVEKVTDAAGCFSEVSFEARAGEIVGVYGFVGAGRSEVAQALFGLRRLRAGTVAVDGEPIVLRSARQAVRHGLAYLPEDRLVQGIFRTHSVRVNASIATLRELATAGWIDRRRERAVAGEAVRAMQVRLASVEQPMGTLSGGNQQKVVFGRWQSAAPKVFLLDEPTRGVDVGAKAEIHRLIGALAERGAAIVLISSELPEIMAMSDRVITLSEGRVTGVFDPGTDGEAAIASAAVPRVPAADARVARRAAWNPRRLMEFREAGLLGFILVLAGVMALAKPVEFATTSNFLDILANAAIPGMVAMGATLIICAGAIDISVGSMMGLVGAIAALAATRHGLPPVVCLGLATALGVAFSLANAGVSLIARIHPIIVTLAGISIYRGLMRAVTDVEITQLPHGYRALADGVILGIPKICYYVVIATVITHLFLRYRLTGRQVLALGNSNTAARLIGLSKTRLTLLVFGISGFLVGLAAVLHAGYYGKVQANTGEGMELRAIAAAVIGGTNILGGRGSALGTLLGAFLVALLSNMLVLSKVSSYWQDAFVGLLILVTVVLDVSVQKWQEGGQG